MSALVDIFPKPTTLNRNESVLIIGSLNTGMPGYLTYIGTLGNLGPNSL